MIGTTLAHYKITAKLGEGGMGAVYRATDLKLHREVAIKVLPESFALDPDRMARFQREAHVLASLNHPNIAAIYGLEERALVMELVEGETLAGPLPLETVISYARQLIDALEAAHEKGIIHRDLKPANIKITPEGQVKVLDFGLAKAVEQTAPVGDPDLSPTLTLTAAATRLGVIMGTAGYMAPEQARGQSVDKRIDIWAFGVVLYEMLTGKRLFAGETVSDTLASVLAKEIDVRGQPLERLLHRCLQRDRKMRLRDIADARADLLEANLPAPVAAPVQRRGLAWPAIAGVLAVALVAAGIGWWMATRPVQRPLLRVDADLGPAITMPNLPGAGAILSPDGVRLVFLANNAHGKSQLMMRRMDQPKAVLMEGTEDAADPFFSPDGQWIGFAAGGKLKKISVDGGAPLTLCDAPGLRGASWGEDGTIVAALNADTPLSRLPASGGPPVQLIPFDKAHAEIRQRWPQILPGGKAALFTSGTRNNVYDDANLDVVSLADGTRKTVYKGAAWARYLPTGHLILLRKGTLFATPFHLDRLETSGTPSPLLEDVASSIGGRALFDYSLTGSAVYQRGGSDQTIRIIQWMDSSGKLTPLLAKPGFYFDPRFSPDGKRLALVINESGNDDIWVYDWQRDAMTRLTFDPQSDDSPVWTPDGRYIAYRSQDGIYLIRADGAGKPRRLTESKAADQVPYSFTPDGKRLSFSDRPFDLWTLPLDVDDSQVRSGKPELYLGSASPEVWPSFSPDGKWMAYGSGRGITETEVFVRPFPDTGGKWQISVGGGNQVVWSRNGHELFYRTGGNRIMAVSYAVKGGSFVADQPRLWSPQPFVGPGSVVNFTLAPDGKRFAVVTSAGVTGEEKPRPQVTFLFNFFDELRRRVPAGGAR